MLCHFLNGSRAVSEEGAKEVYTTEPSRLQEVYFDEKDMRCDVCGLPCKNKCGASKNMQK